MRPHKGKHPSGLDDHLAPYKVPVSAELVRHTRPGWVYEMDCFRRSCLFVLELPESGAVLVYGLIDGFIPHAWVELPSSLTGTEDAVFDGVLQSFYRRADYYAALLAIPVSRYSPQEAARHMRETRTFGPWDEVAMGLAQRTVSMEWSALPQVLQGSVAALQQWHQRLIEKVADPHWREELRLMLAEEMRQSLAAHDPAGHK